MTIQAISPVIGYTAGWPLGRLLDELDEVATWLDDNAPVGHVTPWLIRRDIVREAITRLRRTDDQPPATSPEQSAI